MPSMFLAFILTSFLAYGAAYDLKDLEVLVQEDSQEEFFQHALDIRPSERLEPWKLMVSKMADSYSRKVLARSEIKEQDYKQIEDLFSWPSLKSDDIFKSRRQAIGLRYLKSCLKNENPCWEQVKLFWERDKSDPDTAFKLAKLSGSFENSPISTWSFLEVAFKSPLSEFYCKKEFAMETLWAKIEVDYIRLGQEGDLLVQIDRTVHPDCLPSLIKEARRKLVTPSKTLDRELAFQVLKSQSKADQETSDFFYTVYLLDNPSKGELFNYSWNRIKELGRSSDRRDRVITKLKTLDPLPDQILGSLDQSKKKVVLRHFKLNFPEYLDLYTRECTEYYGGKGSFPSGNPTMHCQEFMDSELAPEILDDYKIKEFQKVRNI